MSLETSVLRNRGVLRNRCVLRNRGVLRNREVSLETEGSLETEVSLIKTEVSLETEVSLKTEVSLETDYQCSSHRLRQLTRSMDSIVSLSCRRHSAPVTRCFFLSMKISLALDLRGLSTCGREGQNKTSTGFHLGRGVREGSFIPLDKSLLP